MGRKERTFARNKQRLDQLEINKQEVKVEQKTEGGLEIGEAILVRQHGGEPRRGEAGRERRRMEREAREMKQSVVLEPESDLNLVTAIGKKDSISGHFNPNYVPQKPFWKFDNWKEREKSQMTISPASAGSGIVVEDLKLHDFFRAEEIRTVVELLQNSIFMGSTLTGIQLNDISVGFAAVALNRFDLIKYLTKEDQFYSFDKLASPITCAILTQRWDIIEYLLQKDIRVHNMDRFGNSPLLQAALAYDFTELGLITLWKIFHAHPITDIISRNNVGLTLTHVLAWRGWVEAMDDILPLNPSRPEEQQMLIELVNTPTFNGTTPLMMALQQGLASSAQLLIARGACVTDEDNDGYTPLCYAIDHMCEKHLSNEPGMEMLSSISAACAVVITALNNPECPMDAKAYAAKRFDLIRHATGTGKNQLHTFYRVGRAVFGFIVRFLEGGLKMMMDMKIFSSILQCGRRNSCHDELMSMLCAITFDILTYAENIPALYSKVCDAFVNDGGATFCHMAMDKYVKRFKHLNTLKNQPNHSNLTDQSSTTTTISEHERGSFGITIPNLIPKIQTNFGIGALLSFIQLIDSPHMEHWFQIHFGRIRRSFDSFHELKMPVLALLCELDAESEERLKRKVYIFDLLYYKYGTWTPLRTIVTDQFQSNGIPYEEGELNKKSLKRRARKDRLLAEKNQQSTNVPS